MRSVRLSVVVAAVLGVLPSVAHAAMTYVPDTGTVARSRGGAFTAAADDPMAIVYNPAGFADQRKMQVYLDITALQLNSTFARASDANGSYKKVTNSGPTKVSPNLIFSMPIGDKLTWHVGGYGAVGVNMKYPETGPQRYTTTFLEPQQLSYSAGVAYRFHPIVAAGFTVGGMYITNQTEVNVTPAFPPNQNQQEDFHAVLDVSKTFTPTGNRSEGHAGSRLGDRSLLPPAGRGAPGRHLQGIQRLLRRAAIEREGHAHRSAPADHPHRRP